MAILSGVERSTSGPLPGANKRTRHSNTPNKMAAGACENLAKHCSPTLQSSSLAEHDADDSLNWPSSGPFTYHRWHLMVERSAPLLFVQAPLGCLLLLLVLTLHDANRRQLTHSLCLSEQLSAQQRLPVGSVVAPCLPVCLSLYVGKTTLTTDVLLRLTESCMVQEVQCLQSGSASEPGRPVDDGAGGGLPRVRPGGKHCYRAVSPPVGFLRCVVPQVCCMHQWHLWSHIHLSMAVMQQWHL